MNKCIVCIYLYTYTNLYHYIEDFCSFMQAWCSAYRHPFYNRSIDFIKLVDFPDCVGRFWKIFLQRKDLELVIRSPASRFCDGGPWPRVWSSVRLTCLALSCVLSGRDASWNATAICVQVKSHNNCTCYAARGWPVATQRCLQICDSGDMSLSCLQDVSVQQVVGMTIRHGKSSSVYPLQMLNATQDLSEYGAARWTQTDIAFLQALLHTWSFERLHVCEHLTPTHSL